MWESIKYVSSAFSLIAFLAVCVITIYKIKTDCRIKQISSAKEGDRVDIIRMYQNRYNIKLDNFTVEQHYSILLEEMKEKSEKDKRYAIIAIIAIIFFSAVLIVAILNTETPSKSILIPISNISPTNDNRKDSLILKPEPTDSGGLTPTPNTNYINYTNKVIPTLKTETPSQTTLIPTQNTNFTNSKKKVITTSKHEAPYSSTPAPTPNPNSTNNKRQDIFISRMLNPPGSEEGSNSRIWISSNKDCDIYIESIRVIHQKGTCSSVGTGKFHIDERLKYSFKSDSDTTHMLDPMLTINHNDNRELVFDLELEPEGYFGSVGGYVTAIVNYHTSDGKVGQIPLIERNEKKIFAQINKSPIVDSVKFSDSLITSKVQDIPYVINVNGLVCGNDNIEQLEILNFKFLDVDFSNYKETKKIENRDIVYNWYKKAQNMESLINEGISNGNIYSIELSTFSDNPETVKSLMNLSTNDKYFYKVCRSIAISELMGIDRNIYYFIKKNIPRIKALRPKYLGDETRTIELLLSAAYLKNKNKFEDIKQLLIENNCYVDEVNTIVNM